MNASISLKIEYTSYELITSGRSSTAIVPSRFAFPPSGNGEDSTWGNVEIKTTQTTVEKKIK